jgi:copper transporter 1
MWSLAHFVLTVLHFVQVSLAYFIMLIIMTYNSWLCASVVIGATVGYFLFGWRKTTIVDVSDHCH